MLSVHAESAVVAVKIAAGSMPVVKFHAWRLLKGLPGRLSLDQQIRSSDPKPTSFRCATTMLPSEPNADLINCVLQQIEFGGGAYYRQVSFRPV